MKHIYCWLLLVGIVGLIVLLPNSHVTAAETDDFVITVKTDNEGISADNQFTIPTYQFDIYNYSVDCDNDGSDEVTGATGDYTCEYAAPGTYTVRIKDNVGDGTGFPHLYFIPELDNLKVISIDQWGMGKWTSMRHAFTDCANMVGNAADVPDLSGVTDMQFMFSGRSLVQPGYR